jgi:hypothetical protein
MIRGVAFRVPQATDETLWHILQCLNVDEYAWSIARSQQEVWGDPHEDVFFDKDEYDGVSFRHLIQTNHFIIFLKLLAYPNHIEAGSIHTYEDFISTDCRLLLLVFDCEHVDIILSSTPYCMVWCSLPVR